MRMESTSRTETSDEVTQNSAWKSLILSMLHASVKTTVAISTTTTHTTEASRASKEIRESSRGILARIASRALRLQKMILPATGMITGNDSFLRERAKTLETKTTEDIAKAGSMQ